MSAANSPQPDNDYEDDFLDEPSPARAREARPPPKQHSTEASPPKAAAAVSSRSPQLKDKAKPQEDTDDPAEGAKGAKGGDLFVLAYRGDVQGLNRALRRGESLHARDQHGWTLLHWATSRAHSNAITTILHAAQDAAAGGDDNDDNHSQDGQGGIKDLLNARDQLNGWTALHLAAIKGHMEVMRQLLLAGASPNLTDKHGDRPVDCLAPGGKRSALMKAWLTGSKGLHSKEDDSEGSESEGEGGEEDRQEAKGSRGDRKDDS